MIRGLSATRNIRDGREMSGRWSAGQGNKRQLNSERIFIRRRTNSTAGVAERHVNTGAAIFTKVTPWLRMAYTSCTALRGRYIISR